MGAAKPWSGRKLLMLVGLAIGCETEPPPSPKEPVEPAGSVEEVPALAGEFALLEDLSDPEHDLAGVVPTLSDLPVPLTKRTLRYVEQFAKQPKGRDSFLSRYRRSQRFAEHIVRALQEAGFPEDLLFLAAIESAFNPQANSPKGAAGLFQFMPETAERFGLIVGSELDERRSIPRSTEAAVAYLGFLHERYQAWDLALAAYNCGEGCVDAAIEKGRSAENRGAGAAVSFAELAARELLPAETRDFVPQIHAFAIVAHNRAALALEEPMLASPLQFAEIAVPPGARLSTVARVGGMTLSELQELNPQLLTDRVPAGEADVLIFVPPERLAQTLAALPAALSSDQAKLEPPAESATKPRKKATPTSPAPVVVKALSESAAVRSEPSFKLKPAPFKPGKFLLPSGVLASFDEKASSSTTLSAELSVHNPLENRARVGEAVSLTARPLIEATPDKSLLELRDELASALPAARASLREPLNKKRQALYAKTSLAAPFEALSSWAFPKGHPDAGLLLVGPTEPADDMFLQPEPNWAFEVMVNVRGPNAQSHAAALDAAMASLFAPKERAALPRSTSVELEGGTRSLLAFAAPPPSRSEEAAYQLAFELACHNKLGRVQQTLRVQKKLTSNVLCALEFTPHAAIAWFLVAPDAPHSVQQLDAELEQTLRTMLEKGVSESELTAARGLVRAEIARELQTASLRGQPKSRIELDAARTLAQLDQVKRAEVERVLAQLFAKDRKFSWHGR
jgi:hypothetical protein